MIPKKLIIFFALVIGGIGYLLKDRSLEEFQTEETRKGSEAKRRLEEQKKKELEKEKRGYRFDPNTCVTNDKDGWEFTKILAIGDKKYRIIDCHKFKGCTEQKDISWTDIDYEFRHGRIIKCSR